MKFADIILESLSDGFFRLDGGAMFGVVPKVVWAKTNPPDDKNRILLGLNPLLIKNGKQNIIIDTGIGDKGDEKFRSIYDINRKPSLKESLAASGLMPEDISIVINTHLHFDHAGGNTMLDREGRLCPTFPNARYFVQKGEWENAIHPNERTKASYHPEDFIPLMEKGQLELVDGDMEIVNGVSVLNTCGHVKNIQLVKIESGNKKAVYLSDIIPTASHIRLPFIMGYDLYPIDSLEVKRNIIKKALEEKWLLIFEHDPQIKMGYLGIKDDKPILDQILI